MSKRSRAAGYLRQERVTALLRRIANARVTYTSVFAEPCVYSEPSMLRLMAMWPWLA